MGYPPAPEPPPERAATRPKREAQEAEGHRRDLERTWGGRIPTDERLLEPDVQMRTLGLVSYDRDLIDRIAEAGPHMQRTMAAWFARYCCTHSGMIANDWVKVRVTALERVIRQRPGARISTRHKPVSARSHSKASPIPRPPRWASTSQPGSIPRFSPCTQPCSRATRAR